MKSALLLLACILQQPQPFQGTLAQGLRRVEELALAGQKDEALALSEQLLAARTERERAAIEYARGVVHAAAKEREPAGTSFQCSRAAGAGELRLASMYNLGSLALEQGEEWFHKLPEISGKPAVAAPPAAGAAPGPGPDALAEARKSYSAARGQFVERLRAHWDDADTRADVELVQRRLKRLDEIEKQRKEEEKKQQQQKKQDSKNDKDKQDPKDPQQKQDPDKQDPANKDPQDSQQPPQDPKDKDKDKDKQDEQKPDQPKPDDPKQGEQPQPQPKDAQEQQLSNEEMTRLLDKLQQLEEQAAKLRAQIHKSRRVAVKKDW